MDLDRIRKEIAEDLVKNPDVPKNERFDDVLALLGELAVRDTPDAEVVDLLLSTAEPETREAFMTRQAERVRKAMTALPQADAVGDLLARERRRSRLTVDQAARILEVPSQVLEQLEGGRAVARILNIPATRVRALTEHLGISDQHFLRSFGRSLPQPSGFVYAYRPRDEKAAPAPAQDAETTKLVDWAKEYAAGR